MPLYQLRYSGNTSIGTNWMFTWWANSNQSTSDIADAGETWITDYWSAVEAIISTTVDVNNVTAVQIDEATGTQIAREDRNVNLPGTSTLMPLPPDVALVVSLRTLTPTRSGRGRFFLPQFDTSTLNTEGRVSEAVVTQILDALDSAWSTFGASGTPMLYSRTNRQAQALFSFNVGNGWDTQRGRGSRLAESRESRTF